MSNETIIHNVFDYGNKIMGYVKHKSEWLYIYVEIELIALVLEQTKSKRQILTKNVFSDMFFNFKNHKKSSILFRKRVFVDSSYSSSDLTNRYQMQL